MKNLIGITSPPYEEALLGGGINKRLLNNQLTKRDRDAFGKRKFKITKLGGYQKELHGSSQGQIGLLKSQHNQELDFDITKYHKCGGELYWYGCYDSENYYKQFVTPESYCFDTQTEILTEDGWKKYSELEVGKNVATLNPTTHKLEYQPIKEIVLQEYHGKMYYLKTKQIDMCVTPNHRLYLGLQTQDNKLRGKIMRFITAKEQFGKIKIFKKDCLWEGKQEEYFILPEIESERSINGRDAETGQFCNKSQNILSQIYVYRIAQKQILMDDWLQFFGLWIAEGSISQNNVNITNNNLSLLQEVSANLPFKPHIYKHEYGYQLVICNKQLAKYLRQFGHAEDKFIPKDIKQLSSGSLKILLEWYLKGDGSRRMIRNGKRFRIDAWTISPKLRDDLLEIALKIGISANYYERNRIGKTTIDYRNKTYTTRKIEYCINFTYQSTPQINNKQHKSNIEKWVDYSGLVWCVVTNNGLIYVRRNGRTYWSGNSHPAKISFLLAERIFKHLEHLGFLKEGMTICDMMAGSGRIPLMASLRGYNSVGIELENHFVEMSDNNQKYAENKIGRKLPMRTIQGDSRNLSKMFCDCHD